MTAQRSLYVMRHGKSDWSSGSGGDHERTLHARGRRAAKRMAELLDEREETPGRVLTSSAVRARTTAEVLCAALESEPGGLSPVVCPELYGAGPEEVLQIVSACGDDVLRLLVCGHEPTCSALVERLTHCGPPEFPPATIARVDFETASWAGIERGELAWLVTPRSLE